MDELFQALDVLIVKELLLEVRSRPAVLVGLAGFGGRPALFTSLLRLQQPANFEEAGLNLSPGRIRSVAECAALRLVLDSYSLRQIRGREQRIASRKAHLIGIEVTLGKMRTTDLIIVLLKALIFGRIQHGDHFRL
jgi:hypothetical protein